MLGHSRRKVEQNPDLPTKPGEGFSEKKDFGSLLAKAWSAGLHGGLDGFE
jgi:hypothetical protein